MTRHVTSEVSAHSVSQMCSYDGGFLHDWDRGRRGSGGGRVKWKEWRERDV